MNLENLTISKGAHNGPSKGMCVMEMVSYVAMEPWSAAPECTSPALSAYARAFNDKLPDDLRQRLKGYIHKMVGLRNDDLEQRIAYMCADRAVRVFAPIALRRAGMEDDARRLEELPEIVDEESASAAARAARRAADRAACNRATYRAAHSATHSATHSAACSAAHSAAASAYSVAYDEGFRLLDDIIDLLKASIPDREQEVLERMEMMPEPVSV